MRGAALGALAVVLAGCGLLLGLEEPSLRNDPPDAMTPLPDGMDTPDATPPTFVSGGGSVGGPISGKLSVYVIDEASYAPIAGASVHVGTALAASTLDGTTGGNGLVVFTSAALSGPQTVTATAAGHSATTWIGVDASELTIPIARSPRESGTITGSISDWDTMTAPAPGHFFLALVSYSTSVGDAAPIFLQPPGGSGRPQNSCFRSTTTSDCSFTLTTRTGPQRLLAIVYDVDTAGTGTPTDDVFQVVGWATGEVASLAASETKNVTLTRVPGADLTPLTTSASSLPGGMTAASFSLIPYYGADERVVGVGTPPQPVLTPSITVIGPGSATAVALGLTAADLAVGVHPDRTSLTPNARAFRLAIDVLAPHAVSAWIDPPTDLSASGGNFSFTRPAGSNLAFADLVTGDRIRWRVFLFDGSTTFRLPAIAPDPLPVGTPATMLVNTLQLPGFDPANFSVLSARRAVSDLSQATLDFTR